MRSLLWIAGTAVAMFSACNYTAGECYPRGQGDGYVGAGGGGVITGGVGAFGNGPPIEPQGISYPEAECNMVTQSPCNEKCLADYDAAAAECGKIQSEAQRKSCQDLAHTAYKACGKSCERNSNDCRERCKQQCDKIHDLCHADCTKNDPTPGCHSKCNDEYGACLKQCDQDCKGS